MRIFIIVFMILLLAGCAHQKPITPKPTSIDNAQIALAEAAKSVSRTLVSLDATEQAAYPPLTISTPLNPATYGMNIPASLDWTGPVEAIVKSIAHAANYRISILGAKPSAPIIVAVHEKHSNLGALLRNIGLQCRHRAQVVVFPRNKTIELRYVQSV